MFSLVCKLWDLYLVILVKEKLYWASETDKRDYIQGYCDKGESLNSTPLETKRGRVFNSCLREWTSTGRCYGRVWSIWLGHLWWLICAAKLGSHPSQRTGSLGAIFFFLFFGRRGCYFSKVNMLRETKSGAYNEKESCLKFNQMEGDIKAFLVTLKTVTTSKSAPFVTYRISTCFS